MSRIRLLTLLLLSASLTACGYSFVLDGGAGGSQDFALRPSTNQTTLIEAGMILDTELERTLSSMGMLAPESGEHILHCTLTSYSSQAITSPSLSSDDRYRLTIHVTARVLNAQGKEVWTMGFSDQGTYPERGAEEDGIEEASRRVSLQIARALAAVSL
ncbi:conserved exported hypothetical protein [anaerobic digester metagenome]|jgi:hypothetical protein|uniref:Lipopolysaccharide-assembly n=1 Tax=anaerobic digester metagenome TaxID=1263854 RepID=A0A485M0S2_9ZZZZ